MYYPESIKAFYSERAELAYTMEHVVAPGNGTRANEERYHRLQGEIAILESAFKETWSLPSSDAVAPLPWCSVCGRNDRLLLPGRMLCNVCNALPQLVMAAYTYGAPVTTQEDTA